MNQRKRVVVFIAITVMLMSMVALTAAPASQGFAPASNTAQATGYVFQTDVDYFMSTTDYGKLGLDKWFGFAGLDVSNYLPALGYAGKLGSIYLGSFYSGNVLYKGASQPDTIQVQTTDYYNSGVYFGQQKITTTHSDRDPTGSFNSAGVLIGVGGMGFKLGFWEDMSSLKTQLSADGSFNNATDSDTTNTTTGAHTITQYTDGSKVSGDMVPSLGWGMNLALGSMTLKPFVQLSADIYKDNRAATSSSYTEYNGAIPLGTTKTTYTAGDNNGYIAPSGMLGASLEIAKDKAVTELGLSYNLTLPLYSNNYKDVTGSDTSVKGTATYTNHVAVTEDANGLDNNAYADVTTSEKSEMDHDIGLMYRYKKEVSDRVSIGFLLNPSVSITSAKSTDKEVQTTVDTFTTYSQDPANSYVETIVDTMPGYTTETSTFSAGAYGAASLAFSVVPETFVLHAGLNVGAPTFTNRTVTVTKSGFETTTDQVVNGNGKVTYDSTSATVGATRNESKTVSNSWNSMSAWVTAGFTLNVAKDMALDALMNSGNTINATTFSLIFTIKQ
jgi:hypothetical protein